MYRVMEQGRAAERRQALWCDRSPARMRTATPHGVERALGDPGAVLDPIVDIVTDADITQHRWHATDMIRVFVRRDDQIHGVDLESGQIGDDPPRGVSGVDERRLSALADEDRVALPYVQEPQLELLRA